MKKTWVPKIIAILITTVIVTTTIHLSHLTGGSLVRKKLLNDEKLVKVLDYIKESGVKIPDISLAGNEPPTYPSFFVFIFLLVSLFLGIHFVSMKIVKKLFNICRQSRECLLKLKSEERNT